VRRVWFVDPRKRIVTVFTAPDQSITLRQSETLTGDPVLPGFQLPWRKLFAEPAEKPNTDRAKERRGRRSARRRSGQKRLESSPAAVRRADPKPPPAPELGRSRISRHGPGGDEARE
jgi:hypothetical protein